MAIPRVFPSGVPSDATITAAQVQQLDQNCADRGLDKRGDTTTGNLNVGAGTTLVVDATGSIVVTAAATIEVQAGGFLTVLGEMDVGNGASSSLLRVKNGATFDVLAGATFDVLGDLFVTSAGAKIETLTGGRFVLGDSDYVTLGAAHPATTSVRRIPFGGLIGMGAGFTYSGSGLGLVGPATSSTSNFTLPIGPGLWNGATVASARVLFTPNASHTGLPDVNVTASLKFFAPNVGGVPVGFGVLGGVGTYSPVSLGDYTDGTIKALTIPIGTPTLDTTEFVYVLSVTDENGSGSLAGNVFHAIEITYSLTDLRPQ